MSIELSYRVVYLARQGGSVKMVLEEVHLVTSEEIERARIEAGHEPETDVDNVGEQLAKIEKALPAPKDPMEHIFWAMKKQFPEMAEAFKSSRPSGSGGMRVMMGPVPVSQLIEVSFTPEQYVALGSPPLLSILKVSMKLEA